MHSNAAWQIWYLWRVSDLELNIWSTSAGLKYAWLGCEIIDSSGSWRSRGMKRLSRAGSLSCILTTKEQMLLTGTCVWTVGSSLVCRMFRAGLANSRALRAIYCRREEVPVSSTRERLPQTRSPVSHGSKTWILDLRLETLLKSRVLHLVSVPDQTKG